MVVFKLNVERWFFGEEAIGGNSGHYVYEEVAQRSMSSVLEFADVF